MTLLRRESLTAITSLFTGGGGDTKLRGKEISRPTKSFATRAWADDGGLESKQNDVDNMENDNELHIELKHAHMQLLAERARVQDLQKNLKTLTAEKYSSQSSIIEQLRSSQDALRAQLQRVIQSKMVLCESTALEIERLRLIIADLTNQYHKATGNKPLMNIDEMMKPFKALSNRASNINYLNELKDNDHIGTGGLNDNDEDDDDNVLLQGGHVTMGGGTGSLQDQLNNPMLSNIGMEQNINNNNTRFPHNNISRIDIRTVKQGDGSNYADPFAAVDLKYTGYKYLADESKWEKFTSPNISSTVFETRLGNHENIIGLEQAVLSMTKGEVAQVWVPSRLGYGIHGAEPLIPPNTDLIFELTLVEIRNDFGINGINDLNGDQNMDNDSGVELSQIQHDNDMDEMDDMDDDHELSPNEHMQYHNDHENMQNNQSHMENNQMNMNQMNLYNSMVDDDENANFQQGSFQVL